MKKSAIVMIAIWAAGYSAGLFLGLDNWSLCYGYALGIIAMLSGIAVSKL